MGLGREVHCYSAQVNALSFNDNRVLLHVTPGPAAPDGASVAVEPATKYVTVQNSVATVDSPGETALAVSRAPGANVIRIGGQVAASGPAETLCVSVHDPALFAATVLREVLEGRGMRVRGPGEAPG